ncbi:hypothetical protein F5X98DRAFT_373431 [Xylaria grammica]|nr:hypothetical protein F5X98DRAFT_373431 [Xylaria grammica]
MRFPRLSLLFTSVIGLSQALVLDQPHGKSCTATSQLREIYDRDDFECDIDDKTQRATCPRARLKEGGSIVARVDIPRNGTSSGI